MAGGAGWPSTHLFTLARFPVTATTWSRREREPLVQERACGLADFLH